VDALLRGLAFLRQKNLIEMEKKSGTAEMQKCRNAELRHIPEHQCFRPYPSVAIVTKQCTVEKLLPSVIALSRGRRGAS